ncbi:hypothetical protein K474DRAFT_1687663 [Panus rudis PR-1116 ss-1]|nr:hypothetical protein K474DRAFT_1687663 [Panus rudis PR-1116 ss-1]
MPPIRTERTSASVSFPESDTNSDRCPHCKKKLKNADGVSRHVQNTQRCRIAREQLILSQNWRPVNVETPDARSESPAMGTEMLQPDDSEGFQYLNGAYVDAEEMVQGDHTMQDGLDVNDNTARWAPFASKDEWELASWLHRSAGHNRIEEFLKSPLIQGCDLSVTSKYKFFQAVDQLPRAHSWIFDQVTLKGDHLGEDDEPMSETVDIWRRDPVECIKEIIGNPAFRDAMDYSPKHLFEDIEGKSRIFEEMSTGDWWWRTQDALPENATVAPVILASDKTKLSQFRGDQTAWPVYLSIGNVAKAKRRQVSSGATVLLGYIPVAKLDCFSDKERSLAGYRLFHHCMRKMINSLIKAGESGVEMVCADGLIRQVYPILAAYIADHPEQCLVVNVQENRCPKGTVDPKERGEPTECLLQKVDETLKLLTDHKDGKDDGRFTQLGLRPVYEPFWQGLPHCNIYETLTPDILHQLHKGVFKTHLSTWCAKILGDEELDRRFKAVSDAPGLRHFKNGISGVSQWTGAEHKEMQKVFIALLASTVPSEVLIVAKALIDFTYFAQFHVHTTNTLCGLRVALNTFHKYKDVFVALKIREHFNIPKIHSLLHYLASIELFGALDGLNTELSERLHIDFAKHGYNAGNHRDYIAHMTTWLARQEAMHLRQAFLDWLSQQEHVATEPDPQSSPEFGELDDEVGDDHGDDMETNTVNDSQKHTQPDIAKKCMFPRRSVEELVGAHGATTFLAALRRYARAQYAHVPYVPTQQATFRVWNQVKILRPWNRSVKDAIVYDRIRATPPFDTVLVIEDRGLYEEGQANEGVTSLSGLRVACVRVIFEVPARLGEATLPLAYLDWFTPFGRLDAATGMHVVTRSTRNHVPNSSVVSIGDIVSPCHLVAKCGGEIDRTLSCSNVLDKARAFFVNPYISVHEFSLFRLHDVSYT